MSDKTTIIEVSIPGYNPPTFVGGLPTNPDSRSRLPLGVALKAVNSETGEPTGERLEIVDGILRVIAP